MLFRQGAISRRRELHSSLENMRASAERVATEHPRRDESIDESFKDCRERGLPFRRHHAIVSLA
jgi:hypothetical protein